MDPITHITSGALAGQAFRDRFPGRTGLGFCIIAAWIPDIDNLIAITGDPETYLLHHRGVTHSFLGGLALAALLVGVFRLFKKSFPLLRGFCVAYGCIAMHIVLDLVTSYGTQIIAPLSDARFAIPSVFIIDPIYTVSMVIFFFLTFRLKEKRRAIAAAGLAWVLAYPLLNLGIGRIFLHYTEKRLTREGVTYDAIHITTEILTPVNWKIVLEDGPTYRMAAISLLSPAEPLTFETFRKADLALMRRLGKRASIFRTFAWFAGYPIMERVKTREGATITFSDARFYSMLPFARRYFKKGRRPFSLTAFLNHRGKITKYEYIRMGRIKIIQHLE
jgi:inner membrane protein